eukprot:scaffold12429_cov37-Prasinocladus_malaysianus.AAC.1
MSVGFPQALSNPRQKAEVKPAAAGGARRHSHKTFRKLSDAAAGLARHSIDHKFPSKPLKDGSQLVAGMVLDMPTAYKPPLNVAKLPPFSSRVSEADSVSPPAPPPLDNTFLLTIEKSQQFY